MRQEVDKESYKASIERLHDIFKDMSKSVEKVSRWRCPYKNAEDRCTANFGCRNQDRDVTPGNLYICNDNNELDYRSAWEI